MTAEREHGHKKPREPGTRALLDLLALGDPNDQLKLGEMLSGLGRRAFGMLLFLAVPPAFIPGVAGVISSPIVVLVGLQLMAGMRKPWLPKFLATRGPHRHVLIRFDKWFSPWLARLEKIIRPRLTFMLDHRLISILTGLMLVLLGVLLALPIPLTNGMFGAVLLLYALALLERDGLLMLAAWALGIAEIGFFGALSGNLVAMATRWIDQLF